jgi:hypothetical protein
MPNLKYGYRTEPMEWSELVEILGDDHGDVKPDLARLSRSVEQQKSYQIYQRDLLLTWRSVLDLILCRKFDAVFAPLRQPIEEGGKLVATPPLHQVHAVHKRLVLNDFPYYMTEDIDHYVLWKIGGGACTEDDIQEAKQQLVQQGYDACMLHWTNPLHLKSIPEVDHIHILARGRRKRPDEAEEETGK